MLYTDSHEWIALSNNRGRVGITKHAQKELGEVVFIELPHVADAIRLGEEACVLESTKAATDVYSPLSGTILAVNEKLRETPSLLNLDPEGAGWLFEIELSAPEETNRLFTKAQFSHLIIHGKLPSASDSSPIP